MEPTDRTCQKYRDWVLSPVGRPEPTERMQVHLDSCSSCYDEHRSLGQDLASVETWLARQSEAAPDPAIAASTLAALPTPSWRLRNPSIWKVPALAMAGLGVGAAGLLYPLPGGLVERSFLGAFIARPLDTIGETFRLVGDATSALVPVAGSGVAGIAAFGAAVGLLVAARRLSRPVARAALSESLE